MARKRADLLVVDRGLAQSRSRAQALIIAGSVIAGDGQRIDKPGSMLDEQIALRLRHQPLPYVSRGGTKLEAGLREFGVEATDRVCLDVGASTGGFTDCLLQHGASRVYAVDVGTNQLAWQLRKDERVVVIERCNIRTIDPALIPETCSLLVADVSFISLGLALPPALRFLAPGADVIALVKPQFEVGKGEVGKGGIVRDEAARRGALAKVVDLFGRIQIADVRTMDSPIQGAKGNREYLIYGRLP